MMASAPPSWKRERYGRMEAARSLLRSAPSPMRSPQQHVNRRGRSRDPFHLSNSSTSNTPVDTPPIAMWASPSGARIRSRPSNLHSAVRSSASFPLSQRQTAASSPVRTPVQRATRTDVQTQTEEGAAASGGIHLGAFGQVATMTAETVDFLIRVLEDRKQELLVNGDDDEDAVRVRAIYAVEEDEDGGSPRRDAGGAQLTPVKSDVARLQLDSANNGGAGVTELVRSHSYEALVQLEGILEARHHKLMNDGVLEVNDDNS